MKKVMFYGFEKNQLQELWALAENLGFSGRCIGDAQLDVSVEEAFGMMEDGDPVHREDVHLFCFFKETAPAEIQQFYEGMKNIPNRDDVLFAVETETNRNWTMRQLMQEVEEENIVLLQAEELEGLLKSVRPEQFMQYSKETQEELKSLLMSGYMLLKSGRYTKEELTGAIASLRTVLEKHGNGGVKDDKV